MLYLNKCAQPSWCSIVIFVVMNDFGYFLEVANKENIGEFEFLIL